MLPGADPAAAPLLGPATLRPLGRAEDLARELVRSLPPRWGARSAPGPRTADIVGGNRSRVGDGDEMLLLPDIWRGRFTDARLAGRAADMTERAESGIGIRPAPTIVALALTAGPKGLPATELDGEQRELLRARCSAPTGPRPRGPRPRRLPTLDAVHIAWAGSVEPGQPHYYRLQAPAPPRRVGQHAARREPRPLGLARPGGGFRARRAGRASGGTSLR